MKVQKPISYIFLLIIIIRNSTSWNQIEIQSTTQQTEFETCLRKETKKFTLRYWYLILFDYHK